MIPRWCGVLLLLAPALVCAGCSCHKKPANTDAQGPTRTHTDPAPPVAEAHPPAMASPAESSPVAATVTAAVTVISLEGAPLAGMQPIITRQPNAFDEPLAAGEPTNAAGQSTFVFPAAEKVCLRAWDPALAYFPNNFFEVAASTESAVTDAQITMVKAVAIHGMFLKADGAPAAGETLNMMMFHPTRGPWWPDHATTGPDGVAEFPRVPPGKYALQFEAPSGRRRLESVTLIPGGVLDLAIVRLEP